MLNYKVTTDAASEPLTKAEVRMQLKNENVTADDDLLDIYIKAARQLVEKKTNTALISKTISQTFTAFPVASDANKYAAFELAVSPLISVTSVVYKDTDGDSNTIDSANYDTDTFSTPGKVAPKPNYTWPTNLYDGLNAITITYVAGYADTTALPAPLREAMLLTIADWYRNRVDRPRKLSSNADWALKDYRVQKF